MKKLAVNLKHCYGINKLDYVFDFSERTFSIYAPNGAMKTSFAKTFKDISNGLEPRDLMFPERETTWKVVPDGGSQINKDSVFVIDPYDGEFKSEKMSTLLVNNELRKKYDEVHKIIGEKRDLLVKKISPLTGLKNDIEDEISLAFTNEKGKLFKALERLEKEVQDKTPPEFADISYKNIINERVVSFLDTKDFKKKISDYIEKYNKLIDASTYFKKGVFNHNNATVIAKSLAENGFFKAKHSVSLNSSGPKKEITKEKDLEEVIESEKAAILNDPGLKAAFEEIDSKLKANKELRDFREYLLNNVKVLPELENLGSLKQKLWVSYLKSAVDEYKGLLEAYQQGKEALEKIVEQAKKEKTDWIQVIEIFNKRFSVPFVLEVENQDDVILKSEIPSIKFVFKDSGGQATVQQADLLKALSNGEKRALYILNIIFEVEARKRSGQETLFIVDDVADSFDYKNKYAIIEYLKEISDEANFFQIILTHNFDFFRTIRSRFIEREQSLMISKTSDQIELIDAGYFQPFTYFKSNLHCNDCILIASIPFARNLVEYTKEVTDADYAKLTSLLHIKPDSDAITKKELADILSRTFGRPVTLTDPDKKVLALIFEQASLLAQANGTKVNLENKIVLSIAIRLKAEMLMIKGVPDKTKISEIKKHQTLQLLELFKAANPGDSRIQSFEQVNLMTPENIHINSFMYEPILDMSDEHLKRLYQDILALGNT